MKERTIERRADVALLKEGGGRGRGCGNVFNMGGDKIVKQSEFMRMEQLSISP